MRALGQPLSAFGVKGILPDPTFRNLSKRSFVGTGDDVLIGGLIIASGEPPVVVVRAIGPELSNYGIAHPL